MLSEEQSPPSTINHYGHISEGDPNAARNSVTLRRGAAFLISPLRFFLRRRTRVRMPHPRITYPREVVIASPPSDLAEQGLPRDGL